MKNMIHELYAGNITPCDRQPSEEYTALNEEFATACSKFLPQLTDEQWPAFNSVMDAYMYLLCCDGKELFQIGFRLGAQLTLEALYPPFSE